MLLRYLIWPLLILFSLSLNAFAIDTPNKVYRFDTRPPVEVFFGDPAGFTPWGIDTNFIDHVAGVTIVSRESAFVSTTSSWETIQLIAQNALFENPYRSYWVYEITPTTNFYLMSSSLLNAAVSLTNLDQEVNRVRQQSIMTLYSTYLWENEWAARGGISRNNIAAARIVIRDEAGNIAFGERFENPYYVLSTPQVNQGNLDIQNTTVDNVYYEDSGHPLQPISLSFIAGSCDGPSQKSVDPNQPACTSLKHNINILKLNIKKIASAL